MTDKYGVRPSDLPDRPKTAEETPPPPPLKAGEEQVAEAFDKRSESKDKPEHD